MRGDGPEGGSVWALCGHLPGLSQGGIRVCVRQNLISIGPEGSQRWDKNAHRTKQNKTLFWRGWQGKKREGDPHPSEAEARLTEGIPHHRASTSKDPSEQPTGLSRISDLVNRR